MPPPRQPDQKYTRPVQREQGANGVEFGGEDFEDYEGEGELAQCGADVGAFEGALGGAYFDQFGGGEDYGAGAVQAEVVVVVGVGLGGGMDGLAEEEEAIMRSVKVS